MIQWFSCSKNIPLICKFVCFREICEGICGCMQKSNWCRHKSRLLPEETGWLCWGVQWPHQDQPWTQLDSSAYWSTWEPWCCLALAKAPPYWLRCPSIRNNLTCAVVVFFFLGEYHIHLVKPQNMVYNTQKMGKHIGGRMVWVFHGKLRKA